MSKETRHHASQGDKPKPMYKAGMKFQTVYLIHGGGDDDSLAYRYSNAERYAQDNNVMLVTPDVANSFGVDTNYSVEYSKFITEELPIVMQSLFASSPKREDNFIVGYAMGGNVALGTAIMHPELYHTCIDMSGGIGLTVNTQTIIEELDSDHFDNFKLYYSTFGKGSEFEGSRHDILSIAKRNLEQGIEVPKFYIIAGSDEPDFIFNRVKADAITMKEIGYDITYIEEKGYKHDFELWDKYLKIALDELLPLKRTAIYPGE
jgi:putative tributyrin esterase